jgi:hypothetical protein
VIILTENFQASFHLVILHHAFSMLGFDNLKIAYTLVRYHPIIGISKMLCIAKPVVAMWLNIALQSVERSWVGVLRSTAKENESAYCFVQGTHIKMCCLPSYVSTLLMGENPCSSCISPHDRKCLILSSTSG